jgi:hypothetical protein
LDRTDQLDLGGKHFSRDLRPLDADGNEISMWSADAQKKGGGSDDDEDDDDEEDESEEDSDDAGPSNQAMSREDRKKEKKARKDAAIARAQGKTVQVGDLPSSDDEEDSDDDMPANPNHSKAARNQTKASTTVDEAAEGVSALSVGGTPSRRERESLEAKLAKERYQKLHEAGKTDEAKADMARLRLIREKREAEAARRQVCIAFAHHHISLLYLLSHSNLTTSFSYT